MNSKIIDHISEKLGESILNYRTISGGDISDAYLLRSTQNAYLLKVNSSEHAYAMFMSEKYGLESIANTKTIATPKVIDLDKVHNESYILLEYIESKNANEEDYRNLGYQLAKLHLNKSKDSLFGFEADNLIGSLPQSNYKHTTWLSFYIEERIIPQLQLAKSKNILNLIDIPKVEQLYEIWELYFKDVKPSLIHGDLWGGNFLIAKNGTPYLIDPAVYYGHGEVDIAMSKLFGGFSTSFYNAYREIIPFDNLTKERIEIYQLYYLLVHFNLFGSSYYESVKRILNQFFN